MPTGAEGDLIRMVQSDPWMMRALDAVAGSRLPDCWIAAGFVRNRVWDMLHGYGRPTPLDDVDVLFFDGTCRDEAFEKRYEESLAQRCPGVRWSVKNQARMHRRNGDRAYRSTADAMCHWCETPTAVAVRLSHEGGVELLAPLGTADLLGLVVRATPHARAHKLSVYRERMVRKNWRALWPRLRVLDV